VVKPFLTENASFSMFSTMKVKLLDEMMQSAYLCVILHGKHKKLIFITVFT